MTEEPALTATKQVTSPATSGQQGARARLREKGRRSGNTWYFVYKTTTRSNDKFLVKKKKRVDIALRSVVKKICPIGNYVDGKLVH